jgi:hypothetical protein
MGRYAYNAYKELYYAARHEIPSWVLETGISCQRHEIPSAFQVWAK